MNLSTSKWILQTTKVFAWYCNLKHHANILEGRCRKGSKGGDSTLLSSKEVTMATAPQSTSQAPVNTSLRETSVWSNILSPKYGREATQAKAHGNAPANLPGTPPPPPKYPRQHCCIGLVLSLLKLYLASKNTTPAQGHKDTNV